MNNQLLTEAMDFKLTSTVPPPLRMPDLENEIWLEDLMFYVLVSNKSRIRTCHPHPFKSAGIPRLGTWRKTDKCYATNIINRNTGKQHNKSVKSLVADNFFPGAYIEREFSRTIHFKDGDSKNSSPENIIISNKSLDH